MVRVIAFFSIKWALMYLTSKREYMGSKWLNENVDRKEL
jgi:hypothetical protein